MWQYYGCDEVQSVSGASSRHQSLGRHAILMTGLVEQLWSKRAHRGPMDALREATLVAGQGLEGSVGRSRRRQITILSREAWESATAAVGYDPGAD